MTICFRARRVYIGKKMHPPILGGSLNNVMVHPIPRHPALLLSEYNTCVEPRRLKRPTRCRIYSCQAVRSTRPSYYLRLLSSIRWNRKARDRNKVAWKLNCKNTQSRLKNHRISDDLVESGPIKECP